MNTHPASAFDLIAAPPATTKTAVIVGDLVDLGEIPGDAWDDELSDRFSAASFTTSPARATSAVELELTTIGNIDRSSNHLRFANHAASLGWPVEHIATALYDMDERDGKELRRRDRDVRLWSLAHSAVERFHPEDVSELLEALDTWGRVEGSAPKVSTGPDPLACLFDAEWLISQQFGPLQYVVPGIIPEGLTVLVAAPKIGKSWMVLGLALAVSSGDEAFGSIPTGIARPVLYLALEDGQRRLRDRIQTLGKIPSNRLQFVIEAPDPVAVIKAFMERHAGEQPVVILDTLGRAMPERSNNESAYHHEYKVTAALKALAVDGASLIVVHHNNKAKHDDYMLTVSGTQGIAGAADTVVVIRRDRNESEALLSVTSRDAIEGEYAMSFKDGTWELIGDDLGEASAAAGGIGLTIGLGDTMAEIVIYVNDHEDGVRASDVAEALSMPLKTVQTYLKRAAEAKRIKNPSRGLYTPLSTL